MGYYHKETERFSRRPYIKIDEEIIYKDEAGYMTYSELNEVIMRCETAIAMCKDRLDELAVKYKDNPRDPEYKNKVVSVNHAMARLREGQLWFSIARKHLKEDRQNSELSMFRTAAAEILDRETFDKISLKAKAYAELEIEQGRIL